jgi:hypothetical protein
MPLHLTSCKKHIEYQMRREQSQSQKDTNQLGDTVTLNKGKNDDRIPSAPRGVQNNTKVIPKQKSSTSNKWYAGNLLSETTSSTYSSKKGNTVFGVSGMSSV